jgi:hypothetical protein
MWPHGDSRNSTMRHLDGAQLRHDTHAQRLGGLAGARALHQAPVGLDQVGTIDAVGAGIDVKAELVGLLFAQLAVEESLDALLHVGTVDFLRLTHRAPPSRSPAAAA